MANKKSKLGNGTLVSPADSDSGVALAHPHWRAGGHEMGWGCCVLACPPMALRATESALAEDQRVFEVHPFLEMWE